MVGDAGAHSRWVLWPSVHTGEHRPTPRPTCTCGLVLKVTEVCGKVQTC